MAVDGSEVAVGVGPFVPDGDIVLVEVVDVGVASEEPEEFVDDGAGVDFFGGDEGEAVGEVETELTPEDGVRAGAGAVVAWGGVGEDIAEEVEVLLHDGRIVAHRA